MARTARKKSNSGVYHVVLRGINKQTIFFDDEDRKVFLNRLKLIKEEDPYTIYAFCLMSNHIHLLVKEEAASIGRIFMKLLSSYVYWYNQKHERIGNLFQDRYKSEPIETDSHLLCALRYIHQNPVKAGMVEKVGDYEWSSHSAYINGKASFVDTELLLGMLNGVAGYEDFVKEEETEEFIDFNNAPRMSDEKLREQIQDICIKYKISSVAELHKEGQDELLQIILQIPGANMLQISRVTGFPMHRIRRLK